MKKITLLFFLFVIIPNAFAQESLKEGEVQTCEVKPDASFIQSLQGQISGLNISPVNGSGNNNGVGCPRGIPLPLPKPLIIIDGVLAVEGSFKNMDPTDIINITILKDAVATSIYGYQGASGVIIIRTEKGLTKRELRKWKRELRRAARKKRN
jgi:TonB-dependent starch-binding outer membrane protein SusC